MRFPAQTDALIRRSFDELIADGLKLIQNIKADDKRLHAQYEASGIAVGYEMHDKTIDYFAFRTSALSLIQLLLEKTERATTICKQIEEMRSGSEATKTIVGTLQGLKRDYENNMLSSLVQMIEANVTADYMSQAEELFQMTRSGEYIHVPPAVLAGAVLEDSLRRLCQRQTPPISTLKSSGHPKTLSSLIDDLKSAGLFNELKAKQLRAWVDIRNSAAHGRFDEFKRADIEQMLNGVQAFLADYM